MHEGFEVLEFAVDGCKADVSNIVKRFQFFHDEDADVLGGNLTAQGILELKLDLGGQLFDLFCCNGAFIAGFHDARKKLGSIEDFLGVVFFDDNERNAFHNLIGGEAILAGQTFTSATDAGIFFCGARVDNFTFGIAANRTFHGDCLQNSRFYNLRELVSLRNQYNIFL